MKYFASKDILKNISNMPQVMTELGMQTYEELQEYYEKMKPFQRLTVILGMVSDLGSLDAFLDPILQRGTVAVAEEEYSRAEWEESTGDTTDRSNTVALQNLVYTARDYGVNVTVTDKMVVKDPNRVVEKLIKDAYEGYVRLLRKLKIEALMRRPIAEDKSTPTLWRRISGFALEQDKVVPHKNGFIEFEEANEEDWSHYRYDTAIYKDIFQDAEDILANKGYGKSQVWIIASKSFFRTHKALFTKDDMEVYELQKETNGEILLASNQPRVYIELPDSDFPPTHYMVIDPTVQGLYELYDEDMQGIVPLFNDLDALKTSKMAEFKRFTVGFGIIEKGFAVMGYVKADATDYVSPVFPR